MKLLCILLHVLWITTTATTGQFHTKLPTSALPVSYELTLEPRLDPDPATFVGNVTIELRIVKPTNSITIHASGTYLNSKDDITLTNSNGEFIPLQGGTFNEHSEQVTLTFQNELQENENYRLTIAYSGQLRHDNQGFYLAKYQDQNGNQRLLANAFFTKTAARTAFPCLDEPALKAKFAIKIIRPENYTSISNEEKVSTVDLGNGRFMDVFKETTNMSTYLVSFAIFDFDHTDKNGLHQMFARPQAIKEGKLEYALKESSQILKAVEEYVDMKYTFSKMDHLAIPGEYFSKEAVENWGLITYNEKVLLYCNKTSTIMNKQQVVTTITHEIIHQWFGNLVTPSEWKYLWLSEGFATYLQFRIGDLIKPSWKLMEQFQNIVVERAFEGESSLIQSSLNDNPQLDWVQYLKAASIIRMMEHFITPVIFRKGLQHYLKTNQFGAVGPSNLYKALQTTIDESEAANLLGNNTLASIMETWDSAVSCPIVNVTRNYKTGHITLEQDQFLPVELRRNKNEQIWYIPINYIFNAESETDFSKTTADYWLTEKMHTLDNNFTTDGWLIVNKQFAGYYRVNYDLVNWNRLSLVLNSPKFETIHVLNRAQLIDDSFDLAKRGILDYKIPLELSKYLLQERHYVPLSSFFNALELLNKNLANSEIYPDFKNYVIEILSGIHEYLGFEETTEQDHLDKLSRANVLKWLCTLGHSECRQVTLNKLRNWKINATEISPNLQEAILCGAIRTGNQEDWDFLFGKYEAAEDFVEKVRILNALLCSEKEEIITRFLEKIFDTNSTLRFVDRLTAVIAVVESGPAGLLETTNYIRQHFRDIFKLEPGALNVILNTIGGRLSTDKELDELMAFKNEHRGMHMAFRAAMTFTRVNIDWKKKHLPQITAWFNAPGKSSATN